MSAFSFVHNLASRRLEPELMDQPTLEADAHAAALRGLRRLNAWSRADRLVWSPIHDLLRRNPDRQRPLRILDAASGAGDVAIRLAVRAQRTGIPVEIHGWDVSPQAIAFARQAAMSRGADVRFEQRDLFAGDWSDEPFDVVTSSLFLHHLDEAQSIELFHRMQCAASEMIVATDLRRCPVGLGLAWSASRILTRSYIVHFDAPQSVRAAFDEREMRRIVDQAGLCGATIDRVWPLRLRIVWRRRQGAGE